MPAFGVITSNTNVGPNVVTSPAVSLLPSSGYAAAGGGAAIIPAGASLVLDNTKASNTIQLNNAAGSAVVLPPATGSGISYTFEVSVVPTSNAHVVGVPNSTDFMVGTILSSDAGTLTGYAAVNSGTVSTNSDSISLNGTTTGGAKAGDRFTVKDVGLNTWLVDGVVNATGTSATMFSAIH